MSDEVTGEGMTDGVWQPLPQGAEYDADQTMHVSFAAQLPTSEPGADPLDPAATSWTIPTVADSADESGEYSVGSFVPAPRTSPAEAVAMAEPADIPAARSAEQSGQWKLPFAAEDGGSEETGEYPVGQPEVPDEPEPAPEEAHSDHPLASYVLRVNGADRPVTDAWLGESLLYVLRERLGLAGAKDGCEEGECGACSVQVDGRLVASCLVPAATAAGSEVRTVEGLGEDGRPSDVQRALAECGAVQCGFCIPGLAMTVHDLLEGNHNPTDLETRQAICGNLCRCSGYRGVLSAVRDIVASREADADGADGSAGRIPHQAVPGGDQ